MPRSQSESVPASMQQTYATITGLTDAFCREHLNGEYAALSRQLAAALARKRPSPLVRGKPDIWACAIVYALGSVNFLFDQSQTPHMRADELCARFGVSKSSAANKAKSIRDLFEMVQMDPRWCLPSQLDNNRLAWLIQVDGFIVDARSTPRAIQEAAYQKGLIPYLPGAKEAASPAKSRQAGARENAASRFSIGDSVVVKPGVRDPDFDLDLGGWQGRIVYLGQMDDGEMLVRIEWDGETLNAMDPDLIDRCEEEGLDWRAMDLYASDIEPVEPRDSVEDVARVAHELSEQHGWSHLGEEGRRIQKVLAGVKHDDVMGALHTWEAYFEENLFFPFEAVVSEYQEHGPLRSGDRVKVLHVSAVDDLYGIIVHAGIGRRRYDFPLCDLEAVDKGSPQYQIVDDYRTWFANR